MPELSIVSDVIGFIITVSVFSTSFLSQRIHATLDAAIKEKDELQAQIIANRSKYDPPLIQKLRPVLPRLRNLAKGDVVTKLTLAANVVLLLITVVLAWIYGANSQWDFTAGFLAAPPAFWALTAAVLTEVAVVAIGIFDNMVVARRATLDPSFSSLLNAEDQFEMSVSENDNAAALQRLSNAQELFEEAQPLAPVVGDTLSMLDPEFTLVHLHARLGSLKVREALLTASDIERNAAWTYAGDAFGIAYELDPTCTALLAVQAQALLQDASLFARARTALTHLGTSAYASANDLAMAWNNLAVLLFLSGDDTDGLKYLENVRHASWISLELCNNFAAYYRRIHDEDAASYFERALEHLQPKQQRPLLQRRAPWWERLHISPLGPVGIAPWKFYFDQLDRFDEPVSATRSRWIATSIAANAPEIGTPVQWIQHLLREWSGDLNLQERAVS